MFAIFQGVHTEYMTETNGGGPRKASLNKNSFNAGTKNYGHSLCMYTDAFIYTLKPKIIHISIMFLKHLQTHGAPGKRQKSTKD